MTSMHGRMNRCHVECEFSIFVDGDTTHHIRRDRARGQIAPQADRPDLLIAA